MSAGQARITFERRGTFAWKVTLLAVTTVALIPILLMKNEWAAKLYIWILVAIHIVGIFVVLWGTKRHHIAPDRRGLVIRGVAIVILVALLYLASKGLQGSTEGILFWGSLFAIWLLHTAGLALLHIRGARENAMCPFV